MDWYENILNKKIINKYKKKYLLLFNNIINKYKKKFNNKNTYL